MSRDTDLAEEITRRKALQYGAATGILGGTAMTAGCLGGGGSDDNGTEDGGGGNQFTDRAGPVEERVDERFTLANHRGTYEFETANWNFYDPNQTMANFDPPGLIYDPVMLHYQSHDEFDSVIADDWEKNGQAIEIEFRDDWYWHDGDQVTTEDFAIQWRIDLEMQRILAPDSRANTYIESIEVPDDTMIRFNLHQDYALEAVLINALTNNPLITKRNLGSPNTYSEWLEQLQNADGDEAETVVSDLQEWRQEEPVGNAVFEVDEITDNSMVTTIFEDHPHSDQILFTEYAIEQHSDKHIAFQEGDIDGAGVEFPGPPDVMQNLPDHYVINGDFNHAWNVLFNFGNYEMDNSPAENPTNDPITSDRNVRHAIATALSREEIHTTVPQQFDLIDYPPSFLNEIAIDGDEYDVSGYPSYDQNEDQAVELMEAAGYERDDGQWYDGDDNEAELTLIGQSGTDVQRQGLDSVQHQLENFGFSTTFDAVDEATYGERRFNGDHDILFDNHPIFSLRGIVWVDYVWDWFHQLNHADFENRDWEIPSPVGEPDSDETMTLNVYDEIEQLNLTGDTQHVQRLSWWFNQTLPMYECVLGRDYGVIQAEDWYVDGPEALIDNRVAEYNPIKKPDKATLAPRQE